MSKTFTARTETTYEVATSYGTTVRVIHAPSDEVATIKLIDADGFSAGEVDFPVAFGEVARALSELFNKVDDEQMAYAESQML
jgi:hypothetical protein